MRTEKYLEQKNRLPATGKQIIGRLENDCVIVYQAFDRDIARYAIANQQFGGDHYSFNRMSWIKPGFLWMMHRAGWATKENQDNILAITIPLIHFKTILKQATLSSFDSNLFSTQEDWENELKKTEVRLQWDPDHDPFGKKEERKAVQIGMKGNLLKMFCREWTTGIEDITEFVKREHQKILNHDIADLTVPYEDIIDLNDALIEKRIGTAIPAK